MANAFSRSLLAMAVFSIFSFMLGWPVISYALFATGMVTVALTDMIKRGRSRSRHQLVGVGVVFMLPCLGLAFGSNPSVLLMLPVAIIVVYAIEFLSSRGRSRNPHSGTTSSSTDDPLMNLLVSLPSAVVLLAFLALA